MNVVPICTCRNRTCTRRSTGTYCSTRCRMTELVDGRTPIDGIRIGQDTYRRIIELADEYGATIHDVIHLLLEAEFGNEE